MDTKMTATKAIKTFFEKDGGRAVTIGEMKALPAEDRRELGMLACEQLGVQFEETAKK